MSTLSSAVTDQFQDEWTQYAPEYLTGLETHEWQAHGTCYSSNLIQTATNQQALEVVQSQYFKNQMELFQLYPDPDILQEIAESKNQTILISDLLAAFNSSSVAFSCDERSSKYYLNSVTFCFGRDSNGNPTNLIPCPATVTTDTYVNSCITSKIKYLYINSWSDVNQA